ncbi:MAG: hypothetical protein ABGX85_07925, partial [Candidatus Lambdaproteobacteria bacterium]
GVPEWKSPKTELQSAKQFYVPVESRPWLIQSGIKQRHAAVSSLGIDNICSHLILSEALPELRQTIKVAETGDLNLFIVTGQDKSAIRKGLLELEKDLLSGKEPASLAYQYYVRSNNEEKFAAVLIGSSRDELQKEIDAAKSGIETSFTGSSDWNSPRGSYFTASPLSREGKVAFTYPGGFSAYVDCGRSLFQMFPGLHELDEQYLNQTGPADKRRGSNYLGELLHERRLYPRTLERLTDAEVTELQKDFIHTPIAMFESGVSSAVLNTHVMRKGFGLEPDIAFGYSMGEISMLYGLGVWESMSNMSDILNSSKLFEERLAGPMNAVREAWDLGPDEFRQKPLWGCYTLRLSPQIVQQEVENEAHVYLILINTPEEVVIAGEPTACERVIQQLGRPVHPIPVTDVVHCEPVKTEYEEIKRVHTDKVIECPDIDFYSAIDYEVSKLDSKTLAHNVASIYGKTVDYSRLIEKVYADGARIFVDMGPRTTCSKWISKTLDKRPHLSISVNRKGTDNREMILQALSSLISHRVPVKLEALFPSQPVQAEKQLMQTIKLGGTPVQQVFEKGADKLFKDTKAQRHQGTEFQSFKVSEFQSVNESGRAYSNFVAPDYAPGNVSVSSFSPFPGEYGSHRNSAHSAFLNVRQHGMRQLAELISSNTNTKGISVSNTFQQTVSQKTKPETQQPVPQTKPCIFDYHDLLELAGGSIANVFGA